MTRDELLIAYAADKRDFSSADLRSANLRGANLRSADLRWISAQGAHWPVGWEIYSVYGIGTLRVIHYRPATDTVFAGCWTGNFAELEAKLPEVIEECDDPTRAKVEYDAMLVYFRALK